MLSLVIFSNINGWHFFYRTDLLVKLNITTESPGVKPGLSHVAT